MVSPLQSNPRKKSSGFYSPEHSWEVKDDDYLLEMAKIKEGVDETKEIKEVDVENEIISLKQNYIFMSKNYVSLHSRLNNLEARSNIENVTRRDTLECVIDKIEEESAFVIVVVNGDSVVRVMSTGQLAKAGVLYEGQPFQIEVSEIKTSEGLKLERTIKPLGDPSKSYVKKARPNLDLNIFKKKSEKD